MILLSLAACAHTPSTNGPQMSPETLKATIDGLVASLPFQATTVGALLGTKLHVTPGSNPHFEMFRASPAGSFQTVEVRQPTAASVKNGKQGMVLLEVASCMQRSALVEPFGLPAFPRPTPAHPGAEPLPAYDTLPRAWGTLSFGFGRDSGCLEKVVLDAI